MTESMRHVSRREVPSFSLWKLFFFKLFMWHMDQIQYNYFQTFAHLINSILLRSLNIEVYSIILNLLILI